MANNKTGFIDLFGPVRAKTENGIVVYPESVAVEVDENGNPIKNLAEAIADGSLGGGNSLEVIDVEELPSPTIDTSTAVPSSGQVGKLYFNTKLSVEKVNEILEGLEYVSGILSNPCVAIATNADMSQGVVLLRNSSDMGIVYVIATGDGQNIYEYVPWNTEIAGWVLSEYELNINNMLSVLAPQVGMTIQNDKLKQLISITPFEAPNTDIQLDKLYRTPIKGGGEWVGTVVPNTGTVDKIYFNTSLAKTEVKNLLTSSITWINATNLGQSGFEFYPILAYMNGSYPYVLAMKKYTAVVDEYKVGDINIALINFANMTTVKNIWVDRGGGWETFENPYSIGFEALSELSGIPIGTQNELIKSMFSTTTFTKVNEQVVGYKYNQFVNGEWKKLDDGKPVIVEIGADNPITVNLNQGITFVDNLETYLQRYLEANVWKQLYNNQIVYIKLYARTMLGTIAVDVSLLLKRTNRLDIAELQSNSVYFELPATGGILSTLQISRVKEYSGYRYQAVYSDNIGNTSDNIIENSDVLVTGGAVYEFVTKYVAEQLAQQSNEE